MYKHFYHMTLRLGPCNKIDKPPVVYRFTGNIITITTLHVYTVMTKL